MLPASRAQDRSAPGRSVEGAGEEQLDLFSASGTPRSRKSQQASGEPISPGELGDADLIAAIPDAGLVEAPALAGEAGRRRLPEAIPALEALCRRFTGFGVDRAILEQVAALEALALIGGPEAARVVARMMARSVVQGPTLATAVAAAARLGSDLPSDLVLGLLHHADPAIRADACRCVRIWPEAIPVLLDLRNDPSRDVRAAAACALGRLGRREALPAILDLLRRTPSVEAIDAVTPVADEDGVVLLARVARTRPDLTESVRDALEAIDHPRAAPLLKSLSEGRTG